MSCLEKIKDSAKKLVDKGVISNEDIDALFNALQKIRQHNRGKIKDIDNFMLEKANEIVDNWVTGMKIEKRNAAFNVLRRAKALEWIENWKEQNPIITSLLPFKKPRASTDYDAYSAFLVGFRGGGDSVSSRMLSKERGIIAGVIAKLQESDLFPILNSRAVDRDIARELWEIRDGGEPGISGNDDARQIANIFHEAQQAVKQMQNDAGAWIGDIPGYIVRQAHDAIKIRQAGADEWISGIMDKLDWEKMAPHLDLEGRLEYLQNVWQNLSDGLHHVSKGAENSERFLDLSSGFKGPANLAKKLSSERVLHFKSADDWFDYNSQYGGRTVVESFFFGVEKGARNAALMEGLGTNPKAMHEHIIETLIAKNRGVDQNAVDQLTRTPRTNPLTWYLDQLTGEINRPGSTGWAVTGSAVRAVQSFSKLGGAILSSFVDTANVIATLRNNNVGWGEALTAPFKSIIRGRGTNSEYKDAVASLASGVDGIMGHVLARWGAADHIPGRLNQIVQQTFKFTGLNWWTDAHKAGTTLTLSKHLALQRNKNWDSLNEDLKRVLLQYFKPEEWDIIRSLSVEHATGDHLILPDAARHLTDTEVKTILNKSNASERQIRLFKDDLENRIRNYYIDQAQTAVPTPGDKEMALMRGGTQPGTPIGEAIRSMMQFKAFPITFISRSMGQFYRNGQANYLGVAQLFAMATAMGYVAMTLKDLSKNRSPRDPFNAKTWLAAAQQGGGLGIYGDFLFGEANRFGGGLVSTLAGPTAGSIEDLVEIIQTPFTLARGDDPKFSTRVLNFVKNHSPYINFFYARGTMDYLILHQFQEALNPGYIDRMKSRVQRENEQNPLVFDPLNLYR